MTATAATLLDVAVLKRHRKLPSEQRVRWHYLAMTGEEVERITAERVEPCDHEPGRGPVERPAEGPLQRERRDLAEHIERVEGWHHHRTGELLVWPADVEARIDWLRRLVPVRDLHELTERVSGAVDPEEE